MSHPQMSLTRSPRRIIGEMPLELASYHQDRGMMLSSHFPLVLKFANNPPTAQTIPSASDSESGLGLGLGISLVESGSPYPTHNTTPSSSWSDLGDSFDQSDSSFASLSPMAFATPVSDLSAPDDSPLSFTIPLSDPSTPDSSLSALPSEAEPMTTGLDPAVLALIQGIFTGNESDSLDNEELKKLIRQQALEIIALEMLNRRQARRLHDVREYCACLHQELISLARFSWYLHMALSILPGLPHYFWTV